MLSIGIFLYHDVEVLDFAGPFEVFSTADRIHRRENPGREGLFQVGTISESGQPVRARGGLTVHPEFSFRTAPRLDVLLVPGGVVTQELERTPVLEWIRSCPVQVMASVCTGAFLLGRAGLLEGRRVVTHWEDVEDLKALLPNVSVEGERRWIDEGAIVTSAGISAGLDMSLHLVARFAGLEMALQTARQMDYEWKRSG